MVTAVYPGRFDPVTYGHLDIARRAASLFDRVVVAVYEISQGTVFTTEERVEMFRGAASDLHNVEVKPFQGLVVDFARHEQAMALVRGIRAVTGFEAEFDMALMNKKMAPELESVYLMANLEYLYLSGTRIREVARLGYDVTNLVPHAVAQALREKFAEAYAGREA